MELTKKEHKNGPNFLDILEDDANLNNNLTNEFPSDFPNFEIINNRTELLNDTSTHNENDAIITKIYDNSKEILSKVNKINENIKNNHLNNKNIIDKKKYYFRDMIFVAALTSFLCLFFKSVK